VGRISETRVKECHLAVNQFYRFTTKVTLGGDMRHVSLPFGRKEYLTSLVAVDSGVAVAVFARKAVAVTM